MMDASLRIDSRQGIQNSRDIHRDRNGSNSERPDNLAHYYRSSSGPRPLSLDAASDTHLNARGPSTDISPELFTKKCRALQDDPRTEHQNPPNKVEDLETTALRDIPRLETSGYSRPSTNPPIAEHMSGLDAIGRRRSQSIGSGPRGSKIAALSVQLRTRLSHAAARIEKKRQSQSQYQPLAGILQKNSSTPILSVEIIPRIGQPLPTGDLDDQRLLEIGSPNGTTISAPDVPATSTPHPLEAPLRPFVANTSGLYPPPQPDQQKYLERSSSEQPGHPGLAPATDIGSTRVKGQRRRPNPNAPGGYARYTPFPLHRRGHSQQDFQMDPEIDRVPETPPLRPSNLNTSASLNMSENSQSSSMEQDAIETLLFMSSPGTSGYHSASQNSQRNHEFGNIDSSAQNLPWNTNPNDSRTSRRQPGSSGMRHPKTADEIDILLDQMDSDSDDEVNYARSSRLEAQSNAIGAGGHDVQHGT